MQADAFRLEIVLEISYQPRISTGEERAIT
jgi:hypothetical protein